MFIKKYMGRPVYAHRDNNGWVGGVLGDYDGDTMLGNFKLLKCIIKKGPNKGTFRYVRIALKQYEFGNINRVVLMETPETIVDCVALSYDFMPLTDRQQMVVPHLQPKEL